MTTTEEDRLIYESEQRVLARGEEPEPLRVPEPVASVTEPEEEPPAPVTRDRPILEAEAEEIAAGAPIQTPEEIATAIEVAQAEIQAQQESEETGREVEPYKPGSTMWNMGFRTSEEYLKAQQKGVSFSEAGGWYGVHEGKLVPENTVIITDARGNPISRAPADKIPELYYEKEWYRIPVAGKYIKPAEARILQKATTPQEQFNTLVTLGVIPKGSQFIAPTETEGWAYTLPATETKIPTGLPQISISEEAEQKLSRFTNNEGNIDLAAAYKAGISFDTVSQVGISEEDWNRAILYSDLQDYMINTPEGLVISPFALSQAMRDKNITASELKDASIFPLDETQDIIATAEQYLTKPPPLLEYLTAYKAINPVPEILNESPSTFKPGETARLQQYLKAEGEYYEKAYDKFAELYGNKEAEKAWGRMHAASWLAPARVLEPTVELEDIKAKEWAIGAVQLALLTSPLWSRPVGKAIETVGSKIPVVQKLFVPKYPQIHPRFTVQEVTSTGQIITRPSRLLAVTPKGGIYEGGVSTAAIAQASLKSPTTFSGGPPKGTPIGKVGTGTYFMMPQSPITIIDTGIKPSLWQSGKITLTKTTIPMPDIPVEVVYPMTAGGPAAYSLPSRAFSYGAPILGREQVSKLVQGWIGLAPAEALTIALATNTLISAIAVEPEKMKQIIDKAPATIKRKVADVVPMEVLSPLRENQFAEAEAIAATVYQAQVAAAITAQEATEQAIKALAEGQTRTQVKALVENLVESKISQEVRAEVRTQLQPLAKTLTNSIVKTAVATVPQVPTKVIPKYPAQPPIVPPVLPTPEIPPPPIMLKFSGGAEEPRKAIARGSITFAMGMGWYYLSPKDFNTAKKARFLKQPPVGAKNTESNSPYDTIQVIGSAKGVPESISIDVGVTDALITNYGTKIQFFGKGELTDFGNRLESTTVGISVPASARVKVKSHIMRKKKLKKKRKMSSFDYATTLRGFRP